MLSDPHFAARESIIRIDSTGAGDGDMPMQNVFPRLSETPGSVRWSGPELGEHNALVYGQLGLSNRDIGDLQSKGVI